MILARSDEEGFEVLEGPGAAVWDLLEEGATAPGIVDALAPSFGASREVIAADVDRLLEELLGRGLAEETRRGRG